MKSITVAGGITRDAEIRQTGNGKSVTGFSVAVDDGWGDNKRTLYFDCGLWGQRGERLAQYLTKGTKVAVTGDFTTREHDGKTYLKINASDVTFLGGGQRDTGHSGAPAPSGPPSGGMDDDLPF